MADKDVMAEALIARRKELGVSQAALAAASGVSRGTIRNIESANVAANESTWERLEPFLGWAQGSLDRLRRGEDPVEVLPPSVSAFIIDVVNEDFDEWEDRGYFIDLITGAGPEGEFDDEARIALTDFLDSLEAEEIEDVHESLAAWFRQAEPRERVTTSLRQVEQTNAGGWIQHHSFGLGEVLSVAGEGADKKALVRFAADLQPRQMLLRFTPYDRVSPPVGAGGEQEPGEAPMSNVESRAAQNLEVLGDEAAKLLTVGQVIDCTVVRPPGTEGMAVVTALVRVGSGPMSTDDRRYASEVLGALSSPVSALRLTDGRIVSVPYTSSYSALSAELSTGASAPHTPGSPASTSEPSTPSWPSYDSTYSSAATWPDPPAFALPTPADGASAQYPYTSPAKENEPSEE